MVVPGPAVVAWEHLFPRVGLLLVLHVNLHVVPIGRASFLVLGWLYCPTHLLVRLVFIYIFVFNINTFFKNYVVIHVLLAASSSNPSQFSLSPTTSEPAKSATPTIVNIIKVFFFYIYIVISLLYLLKNIDCTSRSNPRLILPNPQSF